MMTTEKSSAGPVLAEKEKMSVDLKRWSIELKDVGKRDAVHAPVIIASSLQKLKPGESVMFEDNKCTMVIKCKPEIRHGIVSPFLERDAPAETAVPILLIPDSTSNLRHHYDVYFAGKEEPQEDRDEQIQAMLQEIRVLKGELQDAREVEEDDGCRGCY